MRQMILAGLMMVALFGGASGSQASAAPTPGPAPLAHATLGGGCFWAMQAEFELLKGVKSAVPGYAGGRTANPSYEQVCDHTTGHAEVIDVAYDPRVLSYPDLVRVFLGAHDPTTVDRQGPDQGDNYRSIILTRTPQEAAAARQVIRSLERAKAYPQPIVTQVKPLAHFYRAESYHEHYFALHPNQPYCAGVVAPEVARFRARFADRLARRGSGHPTTDRSPGT